MAHVPRAENELLIALRSPSPTERLRAASHLRTQPLRVPIGELMSALQNESVGQVRRALNEVLRARELVTSGGNAKDGQGVESLDIAMLLQHELSPPIGWARKAGSREIEAFPRSNTNDALIRLERRIDALVSLLKSESPPMIEPIDLGDLLRSSWPDYENIPNFSPPVGPAMLIDTDARMLELVLANLFQNAIDATAEVGVPTTISISWGSAGTNFWMRVMNPFLGNDFAFDDVSPKGVTTKPKHQGIGLTLVGSVCQRLSYEIALAGRSGIATCSIMGVISR